MEETDHFELVNGTTQLSMVGGFTLGAMLTIPYEASLGMVEYGKAQDQIRPLKDEAAKLNFTKTVILNRGSEGLNNIQIIDQEIAQRHQQIEAITAQSPNYHPGDMGVHILEFGVPSAIIMGVLSVALRYKDHKRRQRQTPSATPAIA